nr:MAG TPA: hypothetical protein [Caudoviricetes sp.]
MGNQQGSSEQENLQRLSRNESRDKCPEVVGIQIWMKI